MLLVTLVRHGQSTANAGQATDDPAEIPLSSEGFKQAAGLAGDILCAPDLIITSPFLRARQTADATIQKFPAVPVLHADIHEFTYLDPIRCAGTTQAERRSWVDEYWRRCDPHHRDDGGHGRSESFANLADRVTHFRGFLEGLASDHSNVLVFGHGQFFTAMICGLQSGGEASLREAMAAFRAQDEDLRMGNTEHRTIGFDGSSWTETSDNIMKLPLPRFPTPSEAARASLRMEFVRFLGSEYIRVRREPVMRRFALRMVERAKADPALLARVSPELSLLIKRESINSDLDV